MRLLIECTYVYEHPQDNSGIQRVVRNVINHLPNVKTDVECIPVVMQNNKVYRINQLRPLRPSTVRTRLQNWLSVQHDRLGRLRNRIWNYRARRERSGIFYQSPALRAALTGICRTLGFVISVPQKILSFISLRYVDKFHITEMNCQAGDVLVLLDSSWHADFFSIAERLKKKGVHIVSVIYDLIPLTHPQFCDDGLVRVFDQWFSWISQTANGFIAISHTIEQQVRTEVALRLGPGPAATRWFDYFHLGSDLDQADPGIVVRRDVRKMCKQAPVYLMVSTIEPRKNHAYLLDAFERIWAEDSEACLCFVGKIGWKTEQLIERIRQHPQFQKKLFMFNDLSDRELEHCYTHARSLVFPSYVEGFGLPLVEAMQRGLPAMASDIPVFREIGGDSMVYFDLEQPETLARLIRQFEESGKFPAPRSLADWQWINWQQASQQLIDKIQQHIAVPTTAAPVLSSPRLHNECRV